MVENSRLSSIKDGLEHGYFLHSHLGGVSGLIIRKDSAEYQHLPRPKSEQSEISGPELASITVNVSYSKDDAVEST